MTIVSFARSPRLRLLLVAVLALLVLAGCSGSDGQITDPLDPTFQQDAYDAVARLEGWYWIVVALCAVTMAASFLLQPVLPEWLKSYNLGFRMALLAVFIGITAYKWAMGNAKAVLDGGLILPSPDALPHLLALLAAALTHLLR